jgi:histidine triad (HIT) family protein
MSKCIFCQIVSGTISGDFVYQDEKVMVIRDIHPQAPVHLLVIPKQHIGEFVQASDEIVTNIMQIARKIIEQEHIVQYRLVNNGKGAAFVDHLHLHILGQVEQTRSL